MLLPFLGAIPVRYIMITLKYATVAYCAVCQRLCNFGTLMNNNRIMNYRDPHPPNMSATILLKLLNRFSKIEPASSSNSNPPVKSCPVVRRVGKVMVEPTLELAQATKMKIAPM